MDGIAVKGHLTIYRVDACGRSVVFEGTNLVTNAGLSFLPWMMSNDLSAIQGIARNNDLTVQRMEIGRGGAIPAVTDTSGVSLLVYAPTVEVNVEGVGYPGSLSFGGYLPPSEGNDPVTPGSTSWVLREEALLLGNGVAFAKKVFSVNKNNTFGLYFRHKISFERS
jgi:hypothetical protein